MKYQRPCPEAKDQAESNLCAAWESADAAKAQALWTKAQAIIGALGTIGLLVTIYYTRQSARAAMVAAKVAQEVAADANVSLDISRQTAEASAKAADAAAASAEAMSANVNVLKAAQAASMDAAWESIVSRAPDGQVVGFEFLARWTNHGHTAATHLQTTVLGRLATLDEANKGFVFHAAPTGPTKAHLAAQKSMSTLHTKTLSLEDARRVARNEMRYVLFSHIRYRDIFDGSQHELDLCGLVVFGIDPADMPRGEGRNKDSPYLKIAGYDNYTVVPRDHVDRQGEQSG